MIKRTKIVENNIKRPQKLLDELERNAIECNFPSDTPIVISLSPKLCNLNNIKEQLKKLKINYVVPKDLPNEYEKFITFIFK
eukprot:UN32575